MKIKVETKDFISALSVGGVMAGKVKAQHILDCVKISVKNGYILISSFDNECAVTKRTSIISADEQAEFCVNPKDLITVLKTIRDEEIEICVAGASCDIEHSRGTLSLPVLSVEEFPIPAKDKDAKVVTVSAKRLFDIFKNAKNFTGVNEIRPVFMGGHIEIEGTNFYVAATDTRALFFDEFQIEKPVEDKIEAIVPNSAIIACLGIIGEEETVDISFGECNVVFRASDTKITCRKIIGKYPDVRAIFPKDANVEVVVDKYSLRNAIDRALLTADASAKILKISVLAENSEMGIQSEDVNFNKKCVETIHCDAVSCTDGDFMIGCKGKLIFDGINAVESDKVNFKFSSPQKAFLVSDEECPTKKIILMPVSITY